MKVCTVAIGERYLRLSRRLQESLPVKIEVCTEIPAEVAFRKSDGQYNHHNKRLAIERHYHPQGTLYLDADAFCANSSEFLQFLDSLAALPTGVYSPYIFSSYGFKHPNMPDKTIDRAQLTTVLQFVDTVIPLTDEDLLSLKMPHEWLMFFRFETPQQKTQFFHRYRYLHDIVMNSTCTLTRDCNLIGLAAQHCNVPVSRLTFPTGMRHKI